MSSNNAQTKSSKTTRTAIPPSAPKTGVRTSSGRRRSAGSVSSGRIRVRRTASSEGRNKPQTVNSLQKETKSAETISNNDNSEQEQDIMFIDVPKTHGHVTGDTAKEESHVTSSRSKHPVREINPAYVFEQSQESEASRVYQADLHASSIANITNLHSFTKLRALDLSCNHIAKIKNLDKNSDLRELKLYDNQISLIENLENLKELCHLQLQYNSIQTIGKGLSSLRKLKILRLDSNRLSRIDSRELTSCSGLTSIDVSNNRLESLAGLSCLPNLEELNAINNRLKSVGDLSRCKKLQEVDLSHNRLSNLSGLKGLPNLTVINASNNQLETLKTLGKLKNLLELNISRNKIAETDLIIEAYPGLQILDITDNKLSSWPSVSSLKSLSDLVELYVAGNPFSAEAGPKPQYHTELASQMPALQVLDGGNVKKVVTASGAPVMRPMSAASVVSARQVESQMNSLQFQMSGFHTDLATKFNSLRASFQTLPHESPSRSLTRRTNQTDSYSPTPSGGERPLSRSMARIRDAQQFANEQKY